MKEEGIIYLGGFPLQPLQVSTFVRSMLPETAERQSRQAKSEVMRIEDYVTAREVLRSNIGGVLIP
jgi:hypothetical protein